MSKHRDEPQDVPLRFRDWAFVGMLTMVAIWGALEFVQFLFERLGI